MNRGVLKRTNYNPSNTQITKLYPQFPVFSIFQLKKHYAMFARYCRQLNLINITLNHMETNHTPNLLTTKRLLLNRLLFIGLYLLTGTATLFSQTATVTVDCAATQGTLFRTEAYNNVPGKNTGASTRDSDYIFMNSQGLHAKVARVWLGEGDV